MNRANQQIGRDENRETRHRYGLVLRLTHRPHTLS